MYIKYNFFPKHYKKKDYMNIIKYLRYKNTCPHCGSKLHKNMRNEIFCVRCGLLVLDFFPVTDAGVNHGLYLGRVQWKKRRRKKKKIK